MIVYVIAFYPGYKHLTNLTAMLLAMTSSLFTGAMPSYYQNYVFFNFHGITSLIIDSIPAKKGRHRL